MTAWATIYDRDGNKVGGVMVWVSARREGDNVVFSWMTHEPIMMPEGGSLRFHATNLTVAAA